MIRYHDRKTITRSRKLNVYIDEQAEIVEVATELFQRHWNLEPIRLVGITVQDLENKHHIAKQLNLFTYEQEILKSELQITVDHLSEKYGEDVFKQRSEEHTSELKSRGHLVC